MRALASVWVLVLAGVWTVLAAQDKPPAGGAPLQAPRTRSEASPASERPPETRVPQSYPPEQIEAGATLFAAQCGFCHGRDAAGGAGGTDLTRSVLVAEDVRGDSLGPLIRAGRPAQGMPAFTLSDAEIDVLVAFIHDQKSKAESASGDRRSVDDADLQSGSPAAGQRYFERACTGCHSATGDLAGVATRHQGLALLRRMLYPTATGPGAASAGGPARARAPQSLAVTLPSGQVITGRLAYRDQFTIALIDDEGWYRSWPASQVTYTIDDPLRAHVEQLGKYTDHDMHDVLAYLQTLR